MVVEINCYDILEEGILMSLVFIESEYYSKGDVILKGDCYSSFDYDSLDGWRLKFKRA
eukprot:c50163_g1_i1 orf=296-469(+)